MKVLKYSVVPIFFLLSQLLFGAEQLPLALHLEVAGLTEAHAPEVVGSSVLFTFSPQRNVRFVGIAFESEDFRTIHTFYRNQHGVFFYLHAIPPNQSNIVYRLVVDGLWRSDPQNADTVTDQSGVVLSQVAIPPQQLEITHSPIVKGDGEVEFYFKAAPNRIVTIAGDFNNWDPFMNQLTQEKGRFYTVTLRVSPGTHAYYFVSNGTPISDPLNPRVDYSSDGTKTSVFTVP
ncbi:MAG TPA: hypothetical protein VMW69_10985 [Spirochaetia bacterium]|nr:hypothetical protein [Spirochaetia bacterium]